ncbi:hypothetical protein AAG570_010808 [Ranatra chinensis]|uniref:Reverse transcriptase domain-containing protein n=1 Tax=Ranatra chinensis TaxID=642074 RepID=A0ABD0YIS6_9HEMI
MTAIIIPILKPNKIPHHIDSYRPITLLNTTLKIFEKLLNKRLNWYLNYSKFFHKDQYGYRQNPSTTINAIDKLVVGIRNGFQTKRMTLAVSFDILKAYDTIPTEINNYNNASTYPNPNETIPNTISYKQKIPRPTK